MATTSTDSNGCSIYYYRSTHLLRQRNSNSYNLDYKVLALMHIGCILLTYSHTVAMLRCMVTMDATLSMA